MIVRYGHQSLKQFINFKPISFVYKYLEMNENTCSAWK